MKRIRWWCLFVLFSTGSILFWNFFYQKLKLLKLKLESRLIWIFRIHWWFSFFSFRTEIPFWVWFGSKIQSSRLKTKFGTYSNFKYVKFYGDFHFIYFRPFLQVMSKKLIWHFDVTWLISQRFTRRDFKPVTFHVLIVNLLLDHQVLLTFSLPKLQNVGRKGNLHHVWGFMNILIIKYCV